MVSRPVSFGVFIGLLILLHLVLHLAFGMGAEAPDLITPAALLAARRVRSGAAAGIGFGLGLLDDGLALTTFGASSFALTIVCFLGARSRDLFEGESVLYLLVYVFLGKWLRDLLVFLVARAEPRGDAVTAILVAMPMLAVYSAVAAVIALVIFRAASGERA
jgi:rod shape-determining protein MreD